MLGVYFSGTGNTKFCIEKFLKECGENNKCISIEDDCVLQDIEMNEEIVFAYPIYYSNLPDIVRKFIKENKTLFNKKKIFIIATMGLFSGDGAGCSKRLFKKYGATVIGGLHVKMPDCIGDVKALKKSLNENRAIVRAAEEKIINSANKLKNGKPNKDGLNIFCHIAGLFGQRLWFSRASLKYKDKLKIDKEKCVGCGKCMELCPVKNIEMENKIVKTKGKCIMCYRCVNNCKNKTITLIGKEVKEQCTIEKYL